AAGPLDAVLRGARPRLRARDAGPAQRQAASVGAVAPAGTVEIHVARHARPRLAGLRKAAGDLAGRLAGAAAVARQRLQRGGAAALDATRRPVDVKPARTGAVAGARALAAPRRVG